MIPLFLAAIILDSHKKINIVVGIFEILIMLFLFFFSKPIFTRIHDYRETKRGLNKVFGDNYKIISLSKEKINEISQLECEHVFEVQLKNEKNTKFKAAYCRV